MPAAPPSCRQFDASGFKMRWGRPPLPASRNKQAATNDQALPDLGIDPIDQHPQPSMVAAIEVEHQPSE